MENQTSTESYAPIRKERFHDSTLPFDINVA